MVVEGQSRSLMVVEGQSRSLAAPPHGDSHLLWRRWVVEDARLLTARLGRQGAVHDAAREARRLLDALL